MDESSSRYVCSACGYSRESVEAVVKHIDRSHKDESAAVLEYESTESDGSPTWIGKIVRWVEDVVGIRI
ncbi:hypothetical protein [Halobellus salinisoli]|uniref:hypothetical protein n=1 Tax=Halobellus salinisoli TaxID=3108500 RepID=UPI00300A3353